MSNKEFLLSSVLNKSYAANILISFSGKKSLLLPWTIGHVHFDPCILKRRKSALELSCIYVQIDLLLIFPTIVNKNSTHSRKFKILACTLFFSLGTKVHMTQSSGGKVHLFSVTTLHSTHNLCSNPSPFLPSIPS